MTEYPYVFIWKNNSKRRELRGKRLRVIARGKMGSIEVEFENGSREIISRRSIRRVPKT